MKSHQVTPNFFGNQYNFPNNMNFALKSPNFFLQDGHKYSSSCTHSDKTDSQISTENMYKYFLFPTDKYECLQEEPSLQTAL